MVVHHSHTLPYLCLCIRAALPPPTIFINTLTYRTAIITFLASLPPPLLSAAQIVPLPRDPTVSAILQKYKQNRSKGLPAYVLLPTVAMEQV